MDQLVAKRILFDFEVIVLITLGIGVVLYAFLGSLRRRPSPGIGAKYIPLDLLLIWFPLLFFLINPILSYFYPDAAGLPRGGDLTIVQQLVAGINQLLYFAFIGVITVIILQLITMRDAIEILGLRQKRLPEIIAYGLVGAVISLAICNLLLGKVSTDYLTEKLGELDVQKAVEDMQSAKSLPVIVLSVILACVAAPIVEETLFRGYFYGVLKRFTSPLFGAIISSALFAVVHMNLPALLPLWVFALILTLSYEMSRTLWVPILIHALFNGVNITFLFFGKG